MPPINEYQRDRYASSLVGTPGEDRSGQMLGNSVAQAAGQAEDTAFNIAVKRQRAMDETLAVKKKTELMIQADSLAAQADVDYANFDGSPDDRAAAMRTRYEELVAGTLEPVKSPGARSILEQEGASLIGTYTLNEARKGRANQAVLAAKNTLDTVNLLSVQAAELGRNRAIDPTQRYMVLQGLLQNGENAYRTGYEAYSVADRHKLVKEIPESISKSMLSNMITHNPESVKEFIESGQFDQVLSEPERKKYLDDATDAIPKVQARLAAEQLQADIGQNFQLWDAVIQKDPNALRMIEQSNIKSAATMKDIVIKGREAVIDDYPTLVALAGQIDGLYDKNKKTGAKTGISKKTQLEDFDKVLNFAMIAQRDGKLKESTIRQHIDNLFVPYYNELREGGPKSLDGFTPSPSVFGLLGVATQAVKYWNRSNNLSVESQGRIQEELIARFNPQTIKSEADAAKLAQTAIRNEAVRLSPGLATQPGTPNKVQKADRSQLTVQSEKSDVKNAVQIPAKGEVIVPFVDADGVAGRWIYKDGVLVKTQKVKRA